MDPTITLIFHIISQWLTLMMGGGKHIRGLRITPFSNFVVESLKISSEKKTAKCVLIPPFSLKSSSQHLPFLLFASTNAVA